MMCIIRATKEPISDSFTRSPNPQMIPICDNEAAGLDDPRYRPARLARLWLPSPHLSRAWLAEKAQLYSSLCQSWDQLRGGMDVLQCKDYVLTLLFMTHIPAHRQPESRHHRTAWRQI